MELETIARTPRSHYDMFGEPKKGFTEQEAVKKCYELNSSKFTLHQFVAYKCMSCGKFHIGHTKVALNEEKRALYQKKLDRLTLYRGKINNLNKKRNMYGYC